MIILGIDPGTAATDYGVIKVPDDILGREFNCFSNRYLPCTKIGK